MPSPNVLVQANLGRGLCLLRPPGRSAQARARVAHRAMPAQRFPGLGIGIGMVLR
jgi:hypothetical protein